VEIQEFLEISEVVIFLELCKFLEISSLVYLSRVRFLELLNSGKLEEGERRGEGEERRGEERRGEERRGWKLTLQQMCMKRYSCATLVRPSRKKWTGSSASSEPPGFQFPIPPSLPKFTKFLRSSSPG
jgi:hypothetical protein